MMFVCAHKIIINMEMVYGAFGIPEGKGEAHRALYTKAENFPHFILIMYMPLTRTINIFFVIVLSHFSISTVQWYRLGIEIRSPESEPSHNCMLVHDIIYEYFVQEFLHQN